MRYVVIMAGGSGTRLWPLSRKGEPKQLLPMIDGKSLLRLAYERVQGVVADQNIFICTGAAYSDKVAAQLPEIPKENLMGEPTGRDSLNAVAWPAAVLASRDDKAVVATITADQIITPITEFHQSLELAFQIAENKPECLVTFGVIPTEPHTGYGYLERGDQLEDFAPAAVVNNFKEKPDLATAKEFLATGNYWWNSGMFVWQAQTLLNQLEMLRPDTFVKVSRLAENPDLLEQIYPELEKISVDYAVMEPVSKGKGDAKVVGVPLKIDWHDVGSYVSLAEQLAKDSNGNACQGSVVSLDANNNLLINTRKDAVLAVQGITNMVVVSTDTATLVLPADNHQLVKEIAAVVASEVSPELA